MKCAIKPSIFVWAVLLACGGCSSDSDGDTPQDASNDVVDEDADVVDEDADAVDEDADAVDEDADAVDEDADAVNEDADAADEDADAVDEDADVADEDADVADEDADDDDADVEVGDADVVDVQDDPDAFDPGAACVASGGTVETLLCCEATGPFPNLCLVGACGCAPGSSVDTEVCVCGEGRCFDGASCVEEST